MMDRTSAGKASAEHSETLDVIIDTDIGTDVDDAYAVLLAVSSPELNVRGFTLVHGDILLRAKIIAKLLKLAGRSDIPVIPGERLPINRERSIVWLGHEGRGLDFSDVEDIPASREQAVEFIARTASEHPKEIMLVTIGPLTNAGILVRDFPIEASRLRGIVIMGSALNGFGPENAGREHNVAVDPEAAQIVLESGIPTFVVGLNVSTQTILTREHLEKLSEIDTPLSRLMVHMTDDWLKVIGRDVTHMHDPLAVATLLDSGLATTVPVSAEVSMETPGVITYREAGPESPTRICMSVDAERFHGLFYSRILRAVAG